MIKKLILPILATANITSANNYSTVDLMKKLDVKNPENISFNLPAGYKATQRGAMVLRSIASVYEGNGIIEKSEEGMSVTGTYNQTNQKHKNAMIKVLKEVDSNRNEIVTDKEISKLAKKVFGHDLGLSQKNRNYNTKPIKTRWVKGNSNNNIYTKR